ncbi:MAG: GFA family protein [Gammaproteobacteria bacterium]|nr:GFA family protein [Gammaproteobacteria bacterium]
MRPSMVHAGACHCHRVRFEVDAPARIQAIRCNCSICTMSGFLHLIVPASRFRLLAGAEYLTTYTFNTRSAKHTFCKVCGIKPFYVPRSNPDGYSVNLNCLDPSGIENIDIEEFDGRHWEEGAEALAPLSRDGS